MLNRTMALILLRFEFQIRDFNTILVLFFYCLARGNKRSSGNTFSAEEKHHLLIFTFYSFIFGVCSSKKKMEKFVKRNKKYSFTITFNYHIFLFVHTQPKKTHRF